MGILPLDRTATVTRQGGASPVTNVPCSPAWPVSARPGRTGQQHDHTAQFSIDAAAALQATNAKVTIDGVTYSVIAADEHQFLPHVDCQLRRVRGG